jgi:iron complex transport system substrate-binding protein
MPVADDRGRSVSPVSSPRIVTLAPHLAELVYEAGGADAIVGTVAYSDVPAAASELPVVGDAFRIDLERLAALQPDVVLAWLGGNPDAAIDEVERLGIQVVALQATTLDDIARHLRVIGAVAGTASIAEAAADRYEARLEALRAQYADAAPVRVFYQVADRPLYTVGARHSLNDAIELCGGINVFGGLDSVAPAVTVESVLGAGPEVILTGVHPFPVADPGVLASWNRWQRIPAARGNHLYQLDAGVMGRPTLRLLDGVAEMCARIDRAR